MMPQTIAYTPKFETNRRHRHMGIGVKVAKMWNKDIRSGNYCLFCRVDLGGKTPEERAVIEANHLHKAHCKEWEALILEQDKQATKVTKSNVLIN